MWQDYKPFTKSRLVLPAAGSGMLVARAPHIAICLIEIVVYYYYCTLYVGLTGTFWTLIQKSMGMVPPFFIYKQNIKYGKTMIVTKRVKMLELVYNN